MWSAVVRPDCSTIAFVIEDKIHDFCVFAIQSSDFVPRTDKINAQNKNEDIEEWIVLVAGSNDEKMSVNM